MNKKIISTIAMSAFVVILVGGIVSAKENKGLIIPGATRIHATTTKATSTKATTTPKIKTDVVCIKNAIEKRDTAMIAAYDAYSVAIKKNLTIRKDATKAAYDKANPKERAAAIKKAELNYLKATIKAKKDFMTARKNVWKTFYNERKSCKIVGNQSSEKIDINI